MRRTKIVCTLGPASESPEIVEQLIENGANVFRLNFSHGDHDDHARMIATIRDVVGRRAAPIAILQDLRGPKIRIGDLSGQGVALSEGDLVAACATDAVEAAEGFRRERDDVSTTLPIDLPDFSSLLDPGNRVYINDGLIRLRVEEIHDAVALCRVMVGGWVTSRKGVNLPGAAGRIDPITDKDLSDLEMGLEHGVDFVALSFVRRADDVHRLRDHMERLGRVAPIVAKIEKSEAVDDMEAIVRAADGVMVARGDLGVEVNIEETPLIQKRLIHLSNELGKPVITATQMLESMIENAIPTRAEVSDVANAIFDGTDALMLSGETAVGKRPAEVVAMMSLIATRAERSAEWRKAGALDVRASFDGVDERVDTADAIGHAACQIARDLDVDGVIACTMSGSTARLIARYRPPDPIFAVTPNEETWRRLSLSWGVWPLLSQVTDDNESLIAASLEAVVEAASLPRPARFVLTAGLPIQTRGITNLIRVVTAEK